MGPGVTPIASITAVLAGLQKKVLVFKDVLSLFTSVL